VNPLLLRTNLSRGVRPVNHTRYPDLSEFSHGHVRDLGIFTIVLKIFIELPPDKLVCIARYRCGTMAFSVYSSALGKYEDGGLAFINIGHQWLLGESCSPKYSIR
jgi:hypothetical protein